MRRRHLAATGARTSPGLVVDKYAPPRAELAVLQRPRLFERLTAATRRRVTVVDAPAGSGKTILLDSWLRTADISRSGWLSLDSRDNDPQVFWSGVMEALRRGGAATSGPLSELSTDDGIDIVFVDRFLDAVARLTSPVVLVLDDVHELHDPILLGDVESLVRYAPASLRLVLSGRSRLAVPMARLRVSGELADIGFDDLACVPDEAADLFELLGMDLAHDEIGQLLEHTEGWMTGLRLAALWWSAQPAGSRNVAEFGGDARVVVDYLTDELMQAHSPAARLFLLRTCLVDQIHGSLADALTGDHDGARMLDELERENALVAAVDPHRNWFRYRGLLRDFLRGELGRMMPDEIPRLHRRAAQWYVQHDDIVNGIRSALAAGDADLAGLLLVDHGHLLLARGLAVALSPLLQRIPDEQVRAHPELASILAHARLRLADPDGAEPYLRVAEPAARSDLNDAADRLPADVRHADLRLVQGSLRGSCSDEDIKLASAVLDRATAVTLLPDQQSAVDALTFHLGIAYIGRGEGIAARKALERALQQTGGVRPAWYESVAAWYAVLNATEGRLCVAADTVAALGEQRDPVGGDPAVGPLIELVSAQVWIERDRLDDAWALLDAGRTTSAGMLPGDGSEVPLAIAAQLYRARILIARGDFTAARDELAAARQPAAGLGPHLTHAADLFETEILQRQGRTDEARRLLLNAIERHPMPDLARNAVALGRLRLAEDDATGALAAVQPCLDRLTIETRLLDTVAAHLVCAEAHRVLGAPGAAREHLEHALTLAEPDGLLRVFLDAGRRIRSILTVMIPADGPHAQLRTALLRRFEAQHEPPVRNGRYVAALTDSETAVLRYLPSLLTNEEIAQDLHLSVNTIKSHLRSVYRKLDVANRREAIARARGLNLLSDERLWG